NFGKDFPRHQDQKTGEQQQGQKSIGPHQVGEQLVPQGGQQQDRPYIEGMVRDHQGGLQSFGPLQQGQNGIGPGVRFLFHFVQLHMGKSKKGHFRPGDQGRSQNKNQNQNQLDGDYAIKGRKKQQQTMGFRVQILSLYTLVLEWQI